MVNALRKGWSTAVCVILIVGAVTILTANFYTLNPFTSIAYADPAGIKYTGAGACSAAACHGAQKAAPAYDGDCRHNENTAWSSKDKHAQAFSGKKGLKSKPAAAIAKALGIADATASDRCLNCHSLSGISTKDGVTRVALKPADIVAKGFQKEDGVSCDACHGPAAKYLDPHQGKLWTAGQRKAGSQKLFDEQGLFDTKNLKFRANACLSCHLKIDADMIVAGHPELPFELNLFSMSEEDGGFYAGQHWRDTGKWFAARAWAMGQVVSLREASHQLAERIEKKADAKLIESSTQQVLAHALFSRQIAAKVDAPSKDAIDKELAGIKDAAAVKNLAKVADALADKLITMDFDQKMTEGLLAAAASEGEQAAAIGFRGAEQYTFTLKSLLTAMIKDAKPADSDKKMKAVDDLFEPMADSATYDAAKFAPAATKIKAEFPGGTSIPMPK